MRCSANTKFLKEWDFSFSFLSLSTRVVLIRPAVSTWNRHLYHDVYVNIIQSYFLCHQFVCKVLLYNSKQRPYLDLRSKILICKAKNARILQTFGHSILEAFKVIKFSILGLYRICIYCRRYMKFRAQFRLHAILPFFIEIASRVDLDG